ncbi:hypothetical protein K8R43_02885 [archaeon]|nr:hypothetical protein [archaeon]
MYKQMLVILLMISTSMATNMAIVYEKDGDSITIKETYLLDGNSPNLIEDENASHYIDVNGQKYPIEMERFEFFSPLPSQLFDEDGNQVYIPIAEELYQEETKFEDVIIVPVDNVEEVTLNNKEGNILATAKVDNARDFFQVEAMKILDTGNIDKGKTTVDDYIETLPPMTMFFLSILTPIFEMIGL